MKMKEILTFCAHLSIECILSKEYNKCLYLGKLFFKTGTVLYMLYGYSNHNDFNVDRRSKVRRDRRNIANQNRYEPYLK